MMKLVKCSRADYREDYLGCFGDFSMEDAICRKFCAVSVRCAIERDHIARLDIMEELIAPEFLPVRMQ